MTDGMAILAGVLGMATAALHLGALRRVALTSLGRDAPATSMALWLTLLRLLPVFAAAMALALWGAGAGIALLAGYLGGRPVVLALMRRP